MAMHLPRMNRKSVAAVITAIAIAAAPGQAAAAEFDAIRTEVSKRHDESVKRLQDWIALPSIAAENLNYPAGAEHMAKLAREAGFQQVSVIQTDGKPGVFATLDAGAATTVGLYFMYDVKQFDPAEWTSPPLEARLVDKPGLGKVMMGRGAVNQKGPQAAFLAALHAIRGAGQENAGQPGAGCRRRGGDRIAAYRPDRAPARSRGRAAQDHRRVHALGVAGSRRHRDRQPRRKGRGRARAGVERREMGTGTGQGCPFVVEGDGRQSGLASGQGARHPGVGRRQHHHHRRLSDSRFR